MTTSSDGAGSLLQEGTELYLDGCQALRQYRQRVYELCATVLLGKRKDVESGFDAKFDRHTLKRRSLPDGLDHDGWDDEEAGVYLVLPCIEGSELWVGVYWARSEEGVVQRWASASLSVRDAATLERLWQLGSARVPGRLERDDSLKEMYVLSTITEEGESSLKTRLEEVLQVWTELLQRSGGLKAATAKAGKNTAMGVKQRR